MRTFVIFFLLFAVGTIYGQDNFQRGFIITNQQDTVSGWIDFGMDVQNMAVCRFKACETCDLQTFLPGEIFGYRFYDIAKFYVSKEIEINDVSRTVFLEFLVQGMLNLYYFVDADGIMYYFFENQAGEMMPITKIPDHEVRIEGHGNAQIRQDFRYRGMVRYLFYEQPEMSRAASRVRFDQRSMINLATEYHALTCPIGEECIVFVGKRTNQFTQFKFSAYGGIQLYSERFINIFAPVIGGKMTISNARISTNISAVVDLSIAKIQGDATFNFENTPWYQRRDGGGFGAPDFGFDHGNTFLAYWETSNIFVPLTTGFKYTFGNGKILPILEGGAAFAFIFDRNITFKYGYPDGFVSPLQAPRDIKSFRIYYGGYAGAGLEYKLNNNNSIFINAEANFLAWVNLFQLKVGYTF